MYDFFKTILRSTQRYLLFVLIIVLIGGGFFQNAHGQDKDSFGILFIGNSATYYNNMPAILKELGLKHKNIDDIQTKMLASGGASLKDHWNNPKTKEVIRSDKWDYVVLQEQSTFGGTRLVNGEFRVAEPDTFFTYARRFGNSFGKSDTKIAFFLMWARQNAPETDWNKLSSDYNQIAKELDTKLLPVGLVWQQILQNHKEIKLYGPDGLHPTPVGSYVIAATVFNHIFRSKPVVDDYRVTGKPVEKDNGTVIQDSTSLLLEIEAADVKEINEILKTVGKKYLDEQGYLTDTKKISDSDIPTLPAKNLSTNSDPEGNWDGYTKLYPKSFSWPAQMQLKLFTETGKWSGELHISFGGKPGDIICNLQDVVVTDSTISFIDPKGPNGSIVRYKGVFVKNSIKGIAEIISDNKPLYGIGEWELTKN